MPIRPPDEPRSAVQWGRPRADRVSVEIMTVDQRELAHLACRTAERFAELADVAELMGDHQNAAALRRRASDANERAMALLDE